MPAPEKTNLKAWWALEEASGTRIDSHGANDLTDNATVTTSAGKKGEAANFVASQSEYLNIVDNANLSAGDIDFMPGCWFKLASLPSVAGNLYEIMSQYLSTGNERSWRLLVNTSDLLAFNVHPDGTPTVTVRTAATFGALSTGIWYFVHAWHDPTANTISIQVNNGTVDSVAHTTGIKDSTSDFRMGARDQGGIQDFFDGDIDEAFLFKEILDADERAWLYNNGIGRTYSELTPVSGAPVFF